MIMASIETTNSELPKIEPRIFWINIQFKLLIPLIVGILIAVAAFKLTKVMIPNKWESSAYLIRHAKNMSRQANIPYLYLQTDLNTVLETILLIENLELVITTLTLDISPEALRQAIKVSKGGKSNVIKISVSWSNQETAVDIANLICETFLNNYTAVQNASANKMYQYYDQKLSVTKDQLYKSHLQEKEFKDQNNILDYEVQKSNLYNSISELEMRYIDEKIKLKDLGTRKNKTIDKLNKTNESSVISQLVRTNEVNKTKALKNQLEVLRRRYTNDNPKIQHLMHKISVLEQGQNENRSGTLKFDEVEYGSNPIYIELQLLNIQYDTDILAAKGNIISYQENIKLIKSKIKNLTTLEQQHYQLKHSVETKEALIKTLNNRLVETSIAMESNISDFDVLEYAQFPTSPKRSYRKAISIVFACFISMIVLAIILLREFVDSTVKTAFDLAHINGAKFASVLPNKDEVSESIFYSQFQLLFSATQAELKRKSDQFLTISSMQESDGKSFIANEFIESYLKQNKRILHIESEALLESVPPCSIINRFVNNGLNCNELEPQHIGKNLDKCYFQTDKQIYLDLLEEEQLSKFIQSCKDNYDYVIWELFSPNTHLQLYKTINKQADFTLLLTKSRHTPKATLSNTLQMLNNWEINHVGLLLNLLPKKYIKTTV